MSSIVISDLEFSHPGANTLFHDLNFTVSAGEHAAIVGDNGAGKSSLLKIIAGKMSGQQGFVKLAGSVLYMPQDIGLGNGQTVREMLIQIAPRKTRSAGKALAQAEREAFGQTASAGLKLAEAISDWGDSGGYELELVWESATMNSLGRNFREIEGMLSADLSGGERKRLVLEVILNSKDPIILLDEPDNYLDVPTRVWLEQALSISNKTIVLITHDRAVLQAVAEKIITLEGKTSWTHGGGYRTYVEAREHRQSVLGDDLSRWNEEERRLFMHMKIMKQRAALNDKNASKANAAERRWERFVKSGPPPPPVAEKTVAFRMRGSSSARKVLKFEEFGMESFFDPFSMEVFFGERLGVIGANGTGKTHLLSALSGPKESYQGTVSFGQRVSVGNFTQSNLKSDFLGRSALDIVSKRTGNIEDAMGAMGRYDLATSARLDFEMLSGGQRARLELLCLELEGHNVLLLDEPTDNLDIESSASFERALETFEGTVVAISHDRSFLKKMDRFLFLSDDGATFELLDYETAIAALMSPQRIYEIAFAKLLSV